jgi:ribosomal protein S18 acetylase RimI-like enzyme
MLKRITLEDFAEIETLFDNMVETRRAMERALPESVKDDVKDLLSSGRAVMLATFEGGRPLGFVMSYPKSFNIGFIYADDSQADVAEIKKMLFDEAFNSLLRTTSVIRTGGASIDANLSDYIMKKGFRRYDRVTMRLTREAIESLPDSALPDGFRFVTYESEMRTAIADLIHRANAGHLEAETFPEYFGSKDGALCLIEIIEEIRHHPYSKVLMREREPVGVCYIAMNREEAGHIAEICIDEEYRNRGLGSALLVYVLRDSVKKIPSLKEITLDVTLANPARRLYQSLGFEDTREFTTYTWSEP